MNTRLTPDRVIRFILAAGILAAAVWLLWFFSGLVIYLLAGALLAYVLRPVVDWLQGHGLGRVPAILLTFLLVIGIFSFILASLIPFLAEQVVELSALVNERSIREATGSIERFMGQFFAIREGTIYASLEHAFRALFEQEWISSSVSSIVALFTNIFYALIVIPLVTFFFLKDGVLFHHALLRLIPNRYFETTITVFEKIETNLGRYFKGLLMQMVAVALVATALLLVVGLRGAVSVGIFTGIANTIPYFGPLLGFLAGATIGIAQTGDFSMLPGVLTAMTITQLMDNLLFQPVIFSRATQAHPLVILCVVLIGAELAGILGMLVAIPVATTARVAVEQVLWSLRNYRIFSTTA